MYPGVCPFKAVPGNRQKYKFPGLRAQKCPRDQYFNVTACGCVHVESPPADDGKVSDKFIRFFTEVNYINIEQNNMKKKQLEKIRRLVCRLQVASLGAT